MRVPSLVLALALTSMPALGDTLTSQPLWTVAHPPGANAVAHGGRTIYIASGRTLHLLDMATGAASGEITVDPARFAAITSVAVRDGLVALAATAASAHTDPGTVLLYSASDLTLLREVPVGANPDMLTFNRDGSRLLVANEGEPECRAEGDAFRYVDPEGSISVIDLRGTVVRQAFTINFRSYNDDKAELAARGVRIFGPNATVAQDLEPEHIAVAQNGSRAWVTLQENNAIALVDLWRYPPRVSEILPLGLKDHGATANALDVSDKDGVKGNLQSYPNLFGMYLPDGIVSGAIDGSTYLFTANEGDTRDYPSCFSEEARVADLALDPAVYPAAEAAALGRLRVTTTQGGPGGSYQKLFAFGGRSFAVWSTRGNLLYDSGSTIESILAEQFPGNLLDGRSDDKGPEPEDLAFGRIDGQPYLFVGLERANGVMAFDVGDPRHPNFAGFIANPANAAFPDGENPERLDFVPASESPTGTALLLVTNETSGQSRAFELGRP